MRLSIKVGARGSRLSRVQVDEVWEELRKYYADVEFCPLWVQTTGDKDLKTSLRQMDKSDFFTKEIDALQLAGDCRIAVHSAKDLPDPLPEGLTMVALTRGMDPSDVLVFRQGEGLSTLPLGAKVGTSSARREQNVRELRGDLVCADIRGAIPERLRQLDEGLFDAVVMAEAALIRLGLTERTRVLLPGERAPLQGQLAVLARVGDEEMAELFRCVDGRASVCAG